MFLGDLRESPREKLQWFQNGLHLWLPEDDWLGVMLQKRCHLVCLSALWLHWITGNETPVYVENHHGKRSLIENIFLEGKITFHVISEVSTLPTEVLGEYLYDIDRTVICYPFQYLYVCYIIYWRVNIIHASNVHFEPDIAGNCCRRDFRWSPELIFE